ncbi:MAG: DUF2892 domain-containing protein [Ardenticatenia bacterium]|nr:DUF2892 domain-containing protein [Ardenticatenia bacterium]
MLSRNEASWDRIARVVIGLALIAFSLFSLQGVSSIIGTLVGLILLVTGAVGFCPIYKILGVCTDCSDRAS